MTGGDFEGGLTVDLRVFSEGGRKDIAKQANFSKDLAAIPIGTAIEAYNQKGTATLDEKGNVIGGGTNILDSMGNKYSSLNQMMFNPKLTTKGLTPDAQNLVSYDGNQTANGSDAKNAQGFYDRDNNTAAVNTNTISSDGNLAGTLVHENYHAQIDNQGTAYTQSEENTAHNIGNFVSSRWDTYQSDNTNFQLTLPLSDNNTNGLEYIVGKLYW